MVEADDQGGDAERPHTTTLGVSLGPGGRIHARASRPRAGGQSGVLGRVTAHGASCLLDAGDVACDVLYARRVLHRQPVALALDARLVDEHARIGGQSYRVRGGAIGVARPAVRR